MGRKSINELDKEVVLEKYYKLQKQLENRKRELTITKTKLLFAQEKVKKMNSQIQYQRDRILELHRASASADSFIA